MIVSRDDLEKSLSRVSSAVSDPACGLFGPGSDAWRLNKHSVVFLGGGRAALMQLAHPFVAHAVDQHSQTRTDPQGRFLRTFVNVYAMVFGDLDTALRSARAVHRIHTRVTGEITETLGAYPRGTPYAANDADALMWVHATLVDTVVRVHERVVRPLPPATRERYYDESRRFAYLFGIPDSVQPATWRQFGEYVEDMLASDQLAVGTAGAQLARFLLAPPRPALAPAMRWYRTMTAGLMPARFRQPFGLSFGAADRAVFRASIPSLRAAYRLAPRALRSVPAYVSAQRRIDGKPAGHPMQRVVDRVLALARLRLRRMTQAG